MTRAAVVIVRGHGMAPACGASTACRAATGRAAGDASSSAAVRAGGGR